MYGEDFHRLLHISHHSGEDLVEKLEFARQFAF